MYQNETDTCSASLAGKPKSWESGTEGSSGRRAGVACGAAKRGKGDDDVGETDGDSVAIVTKKSGQDYNDPELRS